MIVVHPSLIVVSAIGVLLFGCMIAILIFKPKLGDKIIESLKTPFVMWVEGSGNFIIVLILLMFIVFSCTLCYQLYGLLLQNLVPQA